MSELVKSNALGIKNLLKKIWNDDTSSGFKLSALKFLFTLICLPLISALPIILFIMYPLFISKYEYVSNMYFFWLCSGLCTLILVSFLKRNTNFWKKHGWIFTIHCVILIWVFFWTLLSSITDTSYINGGHFKLEQSGNCDLLDSDDIGGCEARQKTIIEKTGVFNIQQGTFDVYGVCSLKLRETLPSGFSRDTFIEIEKAFCQKIKIGDRLKLSSFLISEKGKCKGFISTSRVSHGSMKVDVCTTYELMPN